jgi:signal transduction histidine kinase
MRMLDANSDGVWEHNLITDRVLFSEQVWLNLGYKMDEIENTRRFVDEHTYMSDLKKIDALRKSYLDSNTGLFVVEFRLIASNKKLKWYKAKGKILDRDEKNNPISIVGTLTDITQRKIDEKKIKEAERKLLNAVIKTEESERKRFSKDLHDSIGPLLASINLYLSALAEPVSKEKKESILKVASETLAEALISVKEISNNLSPHVLSDFGLVKAIQSFVNKLKHSKSIEISFNSENIDERVNEQIEVVIYRVITELIHNTIKHAKASNIEINLSKEGDILRLIYIDNGVGLDISKMSQEDSTGMGLYNIFSRVRSLNGTHKIQSSSKQKGMMAVIEVPLV